MDKAEIMGFGLASLAIFRGVGEDIVIKNLIKLTRGNLSPDAAVDCYCELVSKLSGKPYYMNLFDYVTELVLYADNVFSRESAGGNYIKLPIYMKDAISRDLTYLSTAACFSAKDLKAFLSSRFPEYAQVIGNLAEYTTHKGKYNNICSDFSEEMAHFAEFYRKNGFSNYAKSRVFVYSDDFAFLPVLNFSAPAVSSFIGYEEKRKIILDNTKALCSKAPANNVLLYGDRGTGKSSTVKALVSEFADCGLRLVQLSKPQLHLLGRVMEEIRDLPFPFVIFLDDISFSANDDGFTCLKAALEGSVVERPPNCAVYATSNRRHFVKENFADREGDEIHLGDTIDETLSLFDRFGITVTYSSPEEEEYFAMVLELAKRGGLEIGTDELISGARRYSIIKSGHSPRVAVQYIDLLKGGKAF